MGCPECNGKVVTEGAWKAHCLACGKKLTRTEIFSRVVGYIRNVDAWNDGKQAEFKDRALFDKSIAVKHPEQTKLKV